MKSLALEVILILAGGLRACCQEGFVVEFDSVQQYHAAGGRSVREVDWGYVLFGHQVTHDGSDRGRCMVYRLGPQGTLLSRTEWDTTAYYDYNFGFMDPVAESPEGFVSAVSRFNGTEDMVFFYRFDANGELLTRDSILYCCTTDSVDFGIQNTRPTADGGYIMTGYWDAASVSSRMLLLKVDSARNLEWQQEWGMNGTLHIGHGVAQYTDGGYVVTGLRFGGGVTERGWLRRTDNLGNGMWTRYYGGFSANGEAVRVDAGGFIYTWSEFSEQFPAYPYAMLRKWSSDGDVVWDTRTHYFQNTRSRDFELLADGNIITCGGQSTTAFIAKYSAEGDSLWSRYLHVFDVWAFHDLFDVTPTSDGGFVLTGNVIQAEADPTPTLQTLWVIKTDSLGCVVPGCQNVGVQEYVLDLQPLLRASPNPASDLVQVALDLPEGGEVEGRASVQLLDVSGRLVLESSVQQHLNQLRTTLDVSALPAGTYYLHLRDAKRWLAGSKVVVE